MKNIDIISAFKDPKETRWLELALFNMYTDLCVMKITHGGKFDVEVSTEVSFFVWHERVESFIGKLFKCVKDPKTTLSIPNLCKAFHKKYPITPNLQKYLGVLRGGYIGHNSSYNPQVAMKEIRHIDLDLALIAREVIEFYLRSSTIAKHV